MPEPSRLSADDYTALERSLKDLVASSTFLLQVSRWLAPGMRVSVEAAYREMVHKTDTALRAHVLRSQAALAVWEVQQLDKAMTRHDRSTLTSS